MKINVLLQARMGSSRLPGKVLLKLANKTVLEHDIERIKKSKVINDIIVCTTTNSIDEPIVDICNKIKVKYYRGDEHNVLDRYYKASILYKSNIIVRITSDCPLIDPEVLDNMIYNYLSIRDESKYYCPKFADPTRGQNFPDGFNPEIFSFEILEEAWKNAISEHDKEHVGSYMKRKYGKLFYEVKLKKEYKNLDLTKMHLSLDTKEDYDLLSDIFNNVYIKNKDFKIDDVLEYLDKKNEKYEVIYGNKYRK